MLRTTLFFLLLLLTFSIPNHAQSTDPVAQALAQGDLYQSKRKYDLALEAYHKADKLAHHSSAACYLRLAAIDRKIGDFSGALDDAKHALKVAGDNKLLAVQAHQVRATLLTQMSGKPTDKKLKEAEDELHQALALDSTNQLSHFNLGMVLLKQERDADGIAELNALLTIPNVTPATAAEARRMIANPIRARAPFAPDFSLTTLENENISNASIKGKVVLLDFWGTWCPPCRESVPILQNLRKKYAGKGFQLVGISSDDDEDVWKTFIAAHGMNWSEYLDTSGEVQEHFKIESFPTYIVLDKDGVIRFRQSGLGEDTSMELQDAINKALKRDSDPKLAAVMNASADAPVSTPSTAPSARQPNAAVTPANQLSSSDQTTSALRVGGIANGIVTGNTYANPALGMTFQFPPNWIPAPAPVIRTVNSQMAIAAKTAILRQHPELADTQNLVIPQIIFYVSTKGGWDGSRMTIPSIRLTALPSRLDSIPLESFTQQAESRAKMENSALMAPPVEFIVHNQHFVRADFDRAVGAVHLYSSIVETVAGEYALTFEILASSTAELQQSTSFLQSIVIADEP